jgi:CBS domain-containing protein/nucleotide-binding universal stress UspA family protein
MARNPQRTTTEVHRMNDFGQILVPVDYSAPSDAALRVAGELARAFKGRLLVLHLMPIQVYALADYPIIVDGAPQTAAAADRLREHVRAVLGDDAPPYEVEATWGSPYLDIPEYAIDRNAGLIVMGTHGRTGLKHFMLGSVAERTVRLAPCPVLTVRGDGGPAEVLAADARAARPPAAGGTRVGTMMSRAPVVVSSTDSLRQAHARMLEAGVRHLPVVDGARLVGMLADRDLAAHVGHLEHTRVNVAMTPEPTTATPEMSVEDAARLMLARRVRALPVLDGERLAGVLSSTDILEDYVRAARARAGAGR